MNEAEEIIPDAVAVSSDPPGSELSISQVNRLQNVTKHNVAELISNAAALVEYYAAIKKLALKLTKPNNWEIIGDNPYLKDTGIKAILPIIGASTRNFKLYTDTEHEEGLGRVDHYTAEGEILFNGKSYAEIGMASTKDVFFAKRNNVFLKWDEVDRANCKKKAVTNLYHRLLMAAFQFSPTIEELKAHFGNAFDKIGKTSFSKGSRGGETDDKETKQKRTELGNLILQLVEGDTSKAQSKLKELTSFTGDDGKFFPGYTDLTKVSVRMLDNVIKTAKEKLEELTKQD